MSAKGGRVTAPVPSVRSNAAFLRGDFPPITQGETSVGLLMFLFSRYKSWRLLDQSAGREPNTLLLPRMTSVVTPGDQHNVTGIFLKKQKKPITPTGQLAHPCNRGKGTGPGMHTRKAS